MVNVVLKPLFSGCADCPFIVLITQDLKFTPQILYRTNLYCTYWSIGWEKQSR